MFTGGTCDSGESHENDVTLYAKIEGRREHIPLDTLTYAAYKVNHDERSRWMGWIDHSLFEPSQEYCVLNSTGTLKHDLPNTCADLGAIGHLCSTALQLLLVTPAAGRPVHCWPGLGKQASKQWAKIVSYPLKTSVVTSPHKKITPVSTQACSSLFLCDTEERDPERVSRGGVSGWERVCSGAGTDSAVGGGCGQSAQAASPLPKGQPPSSHIHHPQAGQ